MFTIGHQTTNARSYIGVLMRIQRKAVVCRGENSDSIELFDYHHLYYHAHWPVTYLHLFHPFHLNFNIILTLFVVVVTSCHYLSSIECFLLSFIDEGNS